jgi:hypothetical protein
VYSVEKIGSYEEATKCYFEGKDTCTCVTVGEQPSKNLVGKPKEISQIIDGDCCSLFYLFYAHPLC